MEVPPCDAQRALDGTRGFEGSEAGREKGMIAGWELVGRCPPRFPVYLTTECLFQERKQGVTEPSTVVGGAGGG